MHELVEVADHGLDRRGAFPELVLRQYVAEDVDCARRVRRIVPRATCRRNGCVSSRAARVLVKSTQGSTDLSMGVYVEDGNFAGSVGSRAGLRRTECSGSSKKETQRMVVRIVA